MERETLYTKTNQKGLLPTIRDFDINERGRICSYVEEVYDNWRSALTGRYNEMLECFKAYHNELLGSEGIFDPNDCDIEWPMCYKTVEVNHPVLYSAMFPNDDNFYDAKVRNPRQPDDEDIINRIISHYLDKGLYKRKFSRAVKQAEICGKSFLKVSWKERVTEVRELVDEPEYGIDEFGNEVRVGVKKRLHTTTQKTDSRVHYEVIPVFDIVLDPTKTEFDESSLIHKTYTSLARLRGANEGTDIYMLDELEERLKDIESDYRAGSRYSNVVSELLELDDVNDMGAMTDCNLEMLEYYGDFFYEGEMYYDYIVTVVDGSLIGFRPNPYVMYNRKPFVYINLIEDAISFHGDKGLISGVKDLHRYISLVARLRINTELRNIYAPIGIREASNLPLDFAMGPNSRIYIDGDDDIIPLGQQINYSVPFEEQRLMENELEEITGATNVVSGTEPVRRASATENTLRSRAVLGRNAYYMENIGLAMKACLEMTWACIRMYADEELLLRLSEDRFKNRQKGNLKGINPKDYDTEIDIKINSVGAETDNSNKLQSLVYIYQLMKGDPELMQRVQTGNIDTDIILREILRYANIESISEILPEEPRLTMDLVMKLMMMFAQMPPEQIVALQRMPDNTKVEQIGQFIERVLAETGEMNV